MPRGLAHCQEFFHFGTTYPDQSTADVVTRTYCDRKVGHNGPHQRKAYDKDMLTVVVSWWD